MKNLYKIQDELYIIDNNEKVTQNGIWAKCSFTGDILKNRNGQYAHKVILTTNNLLIKDGVQAIDDEFLEWFVNNPSCEEVEVVFNNRGISGSEKILKSFGEYKIIIPKNEPKQETLTYSDALKKEERIFNSTMMFKQETLEEVAKRLQKDKYGIFISKDADVKGHLVIDTANAAFLSGMNEGAKWQQEQIGKSEFLQKLRATKSDAEARRLIFETFKKK